jgi:excisionase family DNA binding protein
MKKYQSEVASHPVEIDEIMTIPQVAQYLKLKSRNTVYTLIRNDGLPTMRIGGSRRISKIRLQTWIKQRSM